MPLFVVRWPNLSAALVRARNEHQLIDILDEIANPDGCTWTVYQGPLFLDFELAASIDVDEPEDGDDHSESGDRPLDPARIHIKGAKEMASRDVPCMSVRPIGETGWEMEQAIVGFAFPATAAVYWGDEYEVEPDVLEQALRDDAMRLVEYTWRRSQLHRSADPDAQLALMMDASLQWVKQTGQRVVAQNSGGMSIEDDDDDFESSVEEDVACLLDMARADWMDTHDSQQLERSLKELLEIVTDWQGSE